MIDLHPGQSKVYKDLMIDQAMRFGVVCCARGWGKSWLAGSAAVTAVFELMALPVHVPNKKVYIIAPTYGDVTDIYYPMLNYDMGLEKFAVASSRALGKFVFPGNVELILLSYEAVERMRGKGCYFAVWDEVSSCKKGISPMEAWQGVIQPAILTRWSRQRAAMVGSKAPGRALIIGTPKGYNFFQELHTYQEVDPMWKSYHYDYHDSPFIDEEEIDRLRATLDPIEFASEYLASFQESGYRVFYTFDRNMHVTRDLPYFYKPTKDYMGEDVHVPIDFNVGVQASSAWAIRGNQAHCLDEFKGQPNTEELAKYIKAKYEGHRVFCYPDPTGKARKSSAPVGVTDLSILGSFGFTVLARKKSPPLVDSVKAVNRKMLTADGSIDMYYHPRCKGTITSMERTKWVDNNPDIAVIDKSEGVEHFSDGVRYFTEYLWPVRGGRDVVKRGFNF